MRLVIEISDKNYKAIAKGYFPYGAIVNAIRNGTPLPEHHGRLIDADDIALIDEQFYVPSDYYVAESAINDAPTIIEADEEEQDARI